MSSSIEDEQGSKNEYRFKGEEVAAMLRQSLMASDESTDNVILIGGDRGSMSLNEKVAAAENHGVRAMYYVDGSTPSMYKLKPGQGMHLLRGPARKGLWDAFDHSQKDHFVESVTIGGKEWAIVENTPALVATYISSITDLMDTDVKHPETVKRDVPKSEVFKRATVIEIPSLSGKTSFTIAIVPTSKLSHTTGYIKQTRPFYSKRGDPRFIYLPVTTGTTSSTFAEYQTIADAYKTYSHLFGGQVVWGNDTANIHKQLVFQEANINATVNAVYKYANNRKFKRCMVVLAITKDVQDLKDDVGEPMSALKMSEIFSKAFEEAGGISQPSWKGSDATSKTNARIRDRFVHLRSIIDNGLNRNSKLGLGYGVKQVIENQEEAWVRAGQSSLKFAKYINHDWILPMIKEYFAEDQTAVELGDCGGYIPVQIRQPTVRKGTGEDDTPLKKHNGTITERIACYTRLGADKAIFAGHLGEKEQHGFIPAKVWKKYTNVGRDEDTGYSIWSINIDEDREHTPEELPPEARPERYDPSINTCCNPKDTGIEWAKKAVKVKKGGKIIEREEDDKTREPLDVYPPNKECSFSYCESVYSVHKLARAQRWPYKIVQMVNLLYSTMVQSRPSAFSDEDDEAEVFSEENSRYYQQMGADCLLAVCGVVAAEWCARWCTSALDKTAAKDFTFEQMLDIWLKGKTGVKVPSWLINLRNGRNITYVSANEVYGKTKDDRDFMPTEQDVFVQDLASLKQKAEKMKSEGKGGLSITPKQKAVFIEARARSPILTESAMTDFAAYRCHVLLQAAFEIGSSSHLDAKMSGEYDECHDFADLYRQQASWFTKMPGRGKAADKAMLPALKFLLAFKKQVEMPKSPPSMTVPDSKDVNPKPEERPCDHVVFEDDYARQFLAGLLQDEYPESINQSDDLSFKTSWAELQKLSAKYAVDKCGFHAIGSIIERWKSIPFSMVDNELADVIIHLSRTVLGGYMTGMDAITGVSSYKSDAYKLVFEDINNYTEAGDKRELERQWTEILQEVDAYDTSVDKFMSAIPEIFKGASGGDDNIKAQIPRSEILGKVNKEASDADPMVSMNTNMKTLFLSLAGYLLFDKKSAKDVVANALDEGRPSNLGKRTQVNRENRLIYATPNIDNILQMVLVHAMKHYMKGKDLKKHRVYANANHNTGEAYTDSILCIGYSIKCALEQLCCNANDASGFDMHQGKADQDELVKVIDKKIASEEAESEYTEFRQHFGISFWKWLKKLLLKRNWNYFRLRPGGAPLQTLLVTTQASGDQITTGKNTVKCVAVLVAFLEYLCGEAFGDDMWVVYAKSVLNQFNVMKITQDFEDHGRRAGQVYSYKKAMSGQMVHFLQLLFYGGQIIPRRMALAHEHYITSSLDSLGSLVSKIDKASMRGGNAKCANLWMLMYVIAGSNTSLFGKVMTYDGDTMLSAEGPLHGRLPMPGSADNAKAYLTIHKDLLGFGEWVRKVPKAPRPQEIGRRISTYMNSNNLPFHGTVSSQPMEIGTPKVATKNTYEQCTRSSHKLYHLFGATSKDAQINAAAKARADKVSKSLGDMSIEKWASNTFDQAIGSKMSQGHLAPWFEEQAAIEAGVMHEMQAHEHEVDEVGRAKEPPAEYRLKLPTKAQFRLGDNILTFVPSTVGLYLYRQEATDGATSIGHYGFKIKSKDGTVIKRYNGSDGFRWHPFWSYRLIIKLFMSFFGVNYKGGSVGSRRNILSKFDPSSRHNGAPGRTDLTAEQVFEKLLDTVPGARLNICLGMGFTNDRSNRMIEALDEISTMQSIIEFEEHSNITDPMKCASLDRLYDVLNINELHPKGLANYIVLKPAAKKAVGRCMMNLLYTDMNVRLNYMKDPLKALRNGVIREDVLIGQFSAMSIEPFQH